MVYAEVICVRRQFLFTIVIQLIKINACTYDRKTVTRSTLLRDTFCHVDSIDSVLRYILRFSRYYRPFEYTHGFVIASIADGYTRRSDFEPAHACEFPSSLTHTGALSIRVIALYIVN